MKRERKKDSGGVGEIGKELREGLTERKMPDYQGGEKAHNDLCQTHIGFRTASGTGPMLR